MKIENIEVYGFRRALLGMRNPYNSWDKSDSEFYNQFSVWKWEGIEQIVIENPFIGSKDLKLACNLIKGGSEHRKFLRQIQIWFDITVPRYVWTELDTYKIATVRNSCSTMHKLGTRDLTQEDFELPIPNVMLDCLNGLGNKFRQAKEDKDTVEINQIRRKYKNLLPEGFLQKATYTMNYETALSMYFQRKNHRLPEWNASEQTSICSFISGLPYMKEFIDAVKK